MPATNAVLAAVEDISTLRPFPTVATRLLQLGDQADAEIRDLAEIISVDPAVSLQTLRVANSSLYGLSGQVRSVTHAVVLLGFREVRNLALSLAAGSVFGSGESGRELGADLWKHSLGCAAVARNLAPHYPGTNADEAFLAGILHDVGKLIFFDMAPEDYVRETCCLNPQQAVAAELDYFGVTHPEVGLRCGEEWGLPMDLNDVIGFHHDYDNPEIESDLLDVVRHANHLAKVWGLGSELMPDEAAGAPEAQSLSLSEEQLEEIRQAAVTSYDSLCATCAA